ncbi:hypothetical protein [Myxococcus hansupus]|uniref:hypothetical protein n=1 Tax=Pseudomyxococcus hansupus TaxID=1297742 RepID=UPI000A56CADD|nr:hypothetical protein [Myxococcus hansupus]
MRNQLTRLGVPCLWAMALLGCTSSTTVASSRRDTYALATCTDTVTCCIQRNPGMPEACGLSASEAASHMAGVKMAVEAVGDVPVVWDDTHNAELPEWKRRCIRNYGDCKEGLFAGPCYDCLRMCEGQQDWPLDMCGPKRKKGR